MCAGISSVLWAPDPATPGDAIRSATLAIDLLDEAEGRRSRAKETERRRKEHNAETASKNKRAKLATEKLKAADPEAFDVLASKREHEAVLRRAGKESKSEAGRRCYRIRVYPDVEQRKLLNVWYDAYRYTKNKTIALINETHDWDLQNLRGPRGLVSGGDHVTALQYERFKDVPRDLVDQGSKRRTQGLQIALSTTR